MIQPLVEITWLLEPAAAAGRYRHFNYCNDARALWSSQVIKFNFMPFWFCMLPDTTFSFFLFLIYVFIYLLAVFSLGLFLFLLYNSMTATSDLSNVYLFNPKNVSHCKTTTLLNQFSFLWLCHDMFLRKIL